MKKTIYLRKTKTGPIVQEYPDLKAAKAALGIPVNLIQNIIKTGKKHEGLYLSHEGLRHIPRPKVDLYHSDGTHAGTFRDQVEASRFIGVSHTMVSRVISRPWLKAAGKYYARTHGTKFEFVPKPKKKGKI